MQTKGELHHRIGIEVGVIGAKNGNVHAYVVQANARG